MRKSALHRLTTKLYGPPPGAGATRLERLRYARRVLRRAMLIYVPALIVSLAWSGPLVLAVLGVCIVVSVLNLGALELRLRRAERADR